jgi:hypothetical protein
METTLPDRRTLGTKVPRSSYIALSSYKSRFPEQIGNLEVIEGTDATATGLPGMTTFVITVPTPVVEK